MDLRQRSSRITPWQPDDTLFGAILGVFLGSFVGQLSMPYIVLVVIFFVLFPAIIRKSEEISLISAVLASFCTIFWLILFVYHLDQQAILSLKNGIALVLIVLGWAVSMIVRAIQQ